MLFSDRTDAGVKLAAKVFAEFPELEKNPLAIVFALPRGGVPVAYEISKKLKIPLDLIVTHKLGAEGNPELAIGAVAEDGSVFIEKLYEGIVRPEYLKKEISHQLSEIKKRIKKYRGGRKLPDIKGKTVILVDDGIATGNTMLAAIRMAKKESAAKIIVVTPVLPPDTIEKLHAECDALVYLAAPGNFMAIGQFYSLFEQLEDETVRLYLKKSL